MIWSRLTKYGGPWWSSVGHAHEEIKSHFAVFHSLKTRASHIVSHLHYAAVYDMYICMLYFVCITGIKKYGV